MAERDALLAQLADYLTTACPTRLVTRSLRNPAQYDDAELLDGVLSIIATGEGAYPNLPGRLAQDGRLRLALVGQLRVAEDSAPVAIEQAELTLFEEVIAALAAGSGALRCLDITEFKQSGQLEYPYGWLAIELEWLR